MNRSFAHLLSAFRFRYCYWIFYIPALYVVHLTAEHVPCGDQDLFVDRCLLHSEQVDVLGDNSIATFEPGEPAHVGGDGGKSIWWQFQAPRNGWVTIDIQDGDFLPLIVVYQGVSISELIEITRNDDDSESGLRRQLGFRVLEDESFEIVATGKDGASGTFQFQLTVRPSNDLFEEREQVQVGQSYWGHNRLASMEQNEPIHNTTGPLHATGYASVWYEFTAPEDVQKVTFELLKHSFGEDALPAVAVYNGASFPEDAEFMAANYSGKRNVFAFTVEPGSNYQIAIDGYKTWPHEIPTAYGEFEFRLREGAYIENDDYEHPSPLVLDQEPVRVSALEASENLGGDPGFGGAPAGSTLWWYWYSGDVSQCVTVYPEGFDTDTNGFEPWVGLYSLGVNGELVEEDSGQGAFTFCTDPVPTRYLIGLNHDSWEDVAEYSISLRSTEAPANDDFLNALPIEAGTKVVGENYSATSSDSDPRHSSNLDGRRSVWWKWTAPLSGRMLLQTEGSSFADGLLLSVWEGEGLNSLNQVTRNFRVPEPRFGSDYPDMSAYATFDAQLGFNYWILVEGHENALGLIELLLEEVEAPVNDHIRDALEIPDSGRLAGSINGATMEPGEWAHAGHYPGQSLWWKWTAPSYGFVDIAHASGNDSISSLVAIYSDLSSGEATFDSLHPVAGNRMNGGVFEDRFRVVVDKGVTYYIVVNGRNGVLGNVNLDVSFQSGFHLRNTQLVDGAIQFDVIGELGVGPKYILEASTNLQTWESIEQTYHLNEGQGVIHFMADPEIPYQFFRIAESNGD